MWWAIGILSFLCVGLIGWTVFIVNRYNQLSDNFDDAIEELTGVLEAFDEYEKLLLTIESSDVMIFDPIINELVSEGKELREKILSAQQVLAPTILEVEENE